MSETVERLAKLVWAERANASGSAVGAGDAGSWEEQTEIVRNGVRSDVRAVMRGMLEPTDAQLGAFARACDSHGQCLVRTGWKVMMSEALGEDGVR